MLAISRCPEERIKIGDEIEVLVIAVRGRRVKLGIKAPGKYRISRAPIVKRTSGESPKLTTHTGSVSR